MGFKTPTGEEKEAQMKHAKGKSGRIIYDYDFRVKVIKTALEKNLSAKEVEQVFGVSDACYYNWKRKFSWQNIIDSDLLT